MKIYKTGLFRFRRDLNIDDNIGFSKMTKECETIISLFIFDDKIFTKLGKNDNRISFLKDALDLLDSKLKLNKSFLYIEIGNRLDVIKKIINKYSVDSIYLSKSIFPYTRTQDKILKAYCNEFGIKFNEFDNNTLSPIEKIETRKVFTPFYNKWIKNIKYVEYKVNCNILKSPEINFNKYDIYNKVSNLNKNHYWKAGDGEKILNSFNFKTYEDTRNYPSIDGTSKLSPFIRFGIINPRQVVRKFIKNFELCESFMKELAWREFWYHIAHNFPESLVYEFQEKKRHIKWLNNETYLEKWKQGKTGYPIVDAGIIQLKSEGWMHNRVRMIVASFLTKDLLIDRRFGERFFAKYLIDYDECVNIGNWQWSASVGADPKPLRIFNPTLQSVRFDPNGEYIFKYIPKLKGQALYSVHNPLKYPLKYYTPIVDHNKARILAKKAYYE